MQLSLCEGCEIKEIRPFCIGPKIAVGIIACALSLEDACVIANASILVRYPHRHAFLLKSVGEKCNVVDAS